MKIDIRNRIYYRRKFRIRNSEVLRAEKREKEKIENIGGKKINKIVDHYKFLIIYNSG